MRNFWRRLLAFGFGLLYNELAWLYDPISWLVSLGRWRRWQRTVWAYLPHHGQVLEVGFGPGHLLVDLATAGYRPVGLELSPAMLHLAERRLRNRQLVVPLCRGRAAALPFRSQTFDAVVLTFPTPFVYVPLCLQQLARVLKTGGRLIVAETTLFSRRAPHIRCLEWLYRITGQRGPVPDLQGLLGSAGLAAWGETVEVDGSTVSLVLAEKRATDAQN